MIRPTRLCIKHCTTTIRRMAMNWASKKATWVHCSDLGVTWTKLIKKLKITFCDHTDNGMSIITSWGLVWGAEGWDLFEYYLSSFAVWVSCWFRSTYKTDEENPVCLHMYYRMLMCHRVSIATGFLFHLTIWNVLPVMLKNAESTTRGTRYRILWYIGFPDRRTESWTDVILIGS